MDSSDALRRPNGLDLLNFLNRSPWGVKTVHVSHVGRKEPLQKSVPSADEIEHILKNMSQGFRLFLFIRPQWASPADHDQGRATCRGTEDHRISKAEFSKGFVPRMARFSGAPPEVQTVALETESEWSPWLNGP